MLRYVGASEATVWLETSAACEVEVLGCRSRTFCVRDHHYALVHVTGLEAGGVYEYEVRLDGRPVWPEGGSGSAASGFPPPAIRTFRENGALKLTFGSCRISAPHEPPYNLSRKDDERGLGVDALRATALAAARRLRDGEPGELPDVLVLLGDQIYAHKPPFDTMEFIRSRRNPEHEPGEVVRDFEEYARLYRDSWGDEAVRWLFSTVPSAMIFDDHELDDDWNISESWVDESRLKPWWNRQIIGGYASYWLYQHLGNLSPDELARDDLYRKIRTAGESGDAWPVLRDFAYHAHRTPEGVRWSYHRDFGGVRLVMIDSRGSRVLEEPDRSMLDEATWRWLDGKTTGDFDHLLLGTSVPLLLGPGMHHLQSWDEALAKGVFGGALARWAERVRRAQDLDHWPSFRGSFLRLTRLIEAVANGKKARKGRAPATVTVLSGDVHHGYVAGAGFPAPSDGAQSRVYQAVSSPLRNALPEEKSRLQKNAWTKRHRLAGRLAARLSGAGPDPLTWRLLHPELFFCDQIATLDLEGRAARLTFEASALDASDRPTLTRLLTLQLS